MNIFQIELTEKQWEIVEEVWAKVEQEIAYLTTLSREQRLAWFRAHQYPHPISFEREIGGTVYTVNAHFSQDAEPPEGKVKHSSAKISHCKALKFCGGCGMIMIPCNSYHTRLRKGVHFETETAVRAENYSPLCQIVP